MLATMHTLSARFTYLRNAEAVCVLALPAALCFVWQRVGAPINWSVRLTALAVVSFILLQGAVYWHLKLRTVVARQHVPAWFQPVYRGLRRANCLAILAVGALVTANIASGLSAADLAWSWGLLAFAVLEHINYYHYQLMYDTRAGLAYVGRNKRLRKAALGLDLQRSAP